MLKRLEIVLWLLRGLFALAAYLTFRGLILLEPGATIYGMKNLRLKGILKLGRHSILDVRNCSRVEIGAKVSVGAFSIVRTSHSTEFLCPKLVIGDSVSFGPYCNIGSGYGLAIGDNCIFWPMFPFIRRRTTMKTWRARSVNRVFVAKELRSRRIAGWRRRPPLWTALC